MHCVGKMLNLCNANANATYQGTLTWPYTQCGSQSVSPSVSQSVRQLEPSNGRRPSVDCASLLMPNCAPAFVEFGFCNLLSMPPPSQLLQTRLGLQFAAGAAETGIKNELGVTGGCRSRSRSRCCRRSHADDGDGNVIFAKSFRLF